MAFQYQPVPTAYSETAPEHIASVPNLSSLLASD